MSEGGNTAAKRKRSSPPRKEASKRPATEEEGEGAGDNEGHGNVGGGGAAVVKPVADLESGGADADSDFEDDEPLAPGMTGKELADRSYNCPYLDTINRVLLDFDFEKLCSVTLTNHNVYACLVCGKYFKGRGKGTQALTHSLTEEHHVYLNLGTRKFYCLPDNYEIIDPSLEDIVYYLHPVYTADAMKTVNDPRGSDGMLTCKALDGTQYTPGIVGINNLKANDYVNVALQILACVVPFRDFFLQESELLVSQDALVVTFGELFRKMCNPRNFKNHVSPHEFLQAVVTASKKRFSISKQSDPFDFLSWLLNMLHVKLKQKKKKTIVHKCFKGQVSIKKRKLPPTIEQQEKMGIELDPDDPQFAEIEQDSPFLILPLDLPPPPLFSDVHDFIPQVPLNELLNKFDGTTEKEYKTYKDLFVKKFRIKALPKFLIVHISRFTKNQFFTEKNPTVVHFPISNLVMRDYLELEDGDEQLFRYNLIGNVVHDGPHDTGNYFTQVYHEGMDRWYKTDELRVEDITTLQATITLSTSYMQIWERQPELPPQEGGAAVDGAKKVDPVDGCPNVANPHHECSPFCAEQVSKAKGAAKESPTKPMDSAADP